MDLNNDDETNRALTGEGKVSLLDTVFIGLQKIHNKMEKADRVLKDVIPVLKMMETE